ncbi:STAS domain-containing protein [Nonomuraea sp. NPDC050643]|uniref:STAS domain-containing protein n=1 Tax=Nonomuraea sp. NPDC050643 TaxID=3155660 RepID=UPI0033E3C1B2
MQLSIRLLSVGDTTLVIVLNGELDASTRPDLAAVLDPIPHSPVTHVVVAAGDLSFCDLGGLDQLTHTHRALQAKGGHLAIAEARPTLYRLLDLMAEADIRPTIALYASVTAALAAIAVESRPLDAPPALPARHLPRLRRARNVQAPARHWPPASPCPEPVDPPPTVPIMPVVPMSPISPILARSRALREQTADHHRALTGRLGAAQAAVCRMDDARRRCADSLTTMRATLQKVRTTRAAERTRKPAERPARGEPHDHDPRHDDA